MFRAVRSAAYVLDSVCIVWLEAAEAAKTLSSTLDSWSKTSSAIGYKQPWTVVLYISILITIQTYFRVGHLTESVRALKFFPRVKLHKPAVALPVSSDTSGQALGERAAE